MSQEKCLNNKFTADFQHMSGETLIFLKINSIHLEIIRIPSECMTSHTPSYQRFFAINKTEVD